MVGPDYEIIFNERIFERCEKISNDVKFTSEYLRDKENAKIYFLNNRLYSYNGFQLFRYVFSEYLGVIGKILLKKEKFTEKISNILDTETDLETFFTKFNIDKKDRPLVVLSLSAVYYYLKNEYIVFHLQILKVPT